MDFIGILCNFYKSNSKNWGPNLYVLLFLHRSAFLVYLGAMEEKQPLFRSWRTREHYKFDLSKKSAKKGNCCKKARTREGEAKNVRF